ncbi:hypothetical protein ACIRD8_26585 [Streptomyces sp. NPDC102451]
MTAIDGVLKRIPHGAPVMTNTSATLQESGTEAVLHRRPARHDQCMSGRA